MSIYGKITSSKYPIIMGILNVTPDSFSDGGKFYKEKNALMHAEMLIADGCDIIDIGGESTRPGAESVTPDEEIKRVIPIIKSIKKEFPKIPISIDTTKSDVAGEAINEGAEIINDISGGQFDKSIIEIAKKYDVAYVLMHIKGKPKDMQINPRYDDVILEISDYFEEKLKMLNNVGIKKIIIDPGIGFGKRIEDNFNILNNLDKLTKWNLPILIGISKKSFLGKSLELNVDNREIASIISETIAVLKGCNIVRTHNVKNAVQMRTIYSNLIIN